MKDFTTQKTGNKIFKTWGDFLSYINGKMGGWFEFYKNGKLINQALFSHPKIEDRTGWGH